MQGIWKYLTYLLTVAIVVCGYAQTAYAQCSAIDYTLSSTSVCINESVEVNHTPSPDSVSWNFCSGDLGTPPISTTLADLGGVLSQPYGYDLVESNGQWYAFVTNSSSGNLLRLDYGTSLTNEPSVTDLGTFSAQISASEDITVKKVLGTWYAIITNSLSDPDNTISLLDFGSDIGNANPTYTDLGNFGIANKIRGANFVWDGTDIILILSQSKKNLVIVRFGNSFYNTVDPSDILTTNNVTNHPIFDLEITKYCGDWFIVIPTADKLNVINAGANLFQSTFTSTKHEILEIGLYSFEIKIMDEAGELYAFIGSTSSLEPIILVKLGDISVDVPSFVDPGFTLPVLYAMDVAFDDGRYVLHGIDSDDVVAITYQKNCGESVFSSNADSEDQLSYSVSGTHDIELNTYSEGWLNGSITKSITISTDIAPSISFDNTICISNPIIFTATSDQTITSYLWDFGDTNTSTDPNPSHSYASAGEYDVRLDVTSSSGCNNFTMQTITIYDEPVPDFTLPSGTICTNEEYTFVNNTTDNFDGNLTYDWQVDGMSVGTDRDLIYQFASGGAKDVKLITTIPGCSIESIQNIANVAEGAIASFTSMDDCLSNPLQFTNQSTGDILGYNWDFGDTNSSTDESPSHQYSTAGTYDVVLTVTNTAGCETTHQVQVTAHAIPQPQFSNDLPCSNWPIQFFDETTVASANITIWEWDFGDGNNSTEQNPMHTYLASDNYTVSLTTTSNYGCLDTYTRTVKVAESPVAIMDIDESCIGQATIFTDESSGVIQSRFWSIDGSGYTNNPVDYTFDQPGEYEIILNVTADNLCSSSTSTMISVEEVPQASFTVNNQCVGAPTSFVENTDSPNDIIVSWFWNFDGLGDGDTPTPNFQFEQPGNYNVSLDIVTEKGCVSSISEQVEVYTNPVADFSISELYGPPPFSVNFTNMSEGAESYLWEYGNALGWSSELDGGFTFEQEGTYTVKLTSIAASGCEATKEAVVYAVNPEIDLEIDNALLMDEGVYLLTFSNHSNIPIEQFSLNIDLGSKVSLTELVELPLAPGQSANHQIPFIIPSNDVEHVCFNAIYEGVLEESNLSNNEVCVTTTESNVMLKAYPNPVQDFLVLPVVAKSGDRLGVQLIDVAGNVLLHNDYTLADDGLNELTLDFSLIRKGIYVLKLSSKGTTQVQRVFVE